MPPESVNYLFALARTGYRSEFFSDFGKVTKISFQTLKIINAIFLFCFFGIYTGRESTLGVSEIGQTIEIFRISLANAIATFDFFKTPKSSLCML